MNPIEMATNKQDTRVLNAHRPPRISSGQWHIGDRVGLATVVLAYRDAYAELEETLEEANATITAQQAVIDVLKAQLAALADERGRLNGWQR